MSFFKVISGTSNNFLNRFSYGVTNSTKFMAEASLCCTNMPWCMFVKNIASLVKFSYSNTFFALLYDNIDV